MHPEYLLMPNIPKPLHGIAPRTIFGQEWWDKNRQETYKNANYKCEACGVDKKDALFHKWLEAHERYNINYEFGEMTFVGLVALCHACHNFIHSGRLSILLESNEISKDKYRIIIEHGNSILKKYKLNRPPPPTIIAKWSDWRMVYNNVRYGPSSENFDEWVRGAWKNWKPNAR
jgi:hypothetical protein